MIEKPILKPLIALLHSRRFMLLLLTLIAFFLIPQVQTLSDVWKERLANIVFYGGAALFMAFTGEDLITTWQQPDKPGSVDDVLKGLFEEILKATQPIQPVAIGKVEIKADPPLSADVRDPLLLRTDKPGNG